MEGWVEELSGHDDYFLFMRSDPLWVSSSFAEQDSFPRNGSVTGALSAATGA